jgi:hypothetical protein
MSRDGPTRSPSADGVSKWPCEDQYRFDRVKPGQEWAALIWESCREWVECPQNETKEARGTERTRTIGTLRRHEFFPDSPWLTLTTEQRTQLAESFCVAPGEIESYGALVDSPSKTADEWRVFLRRQGCVVFDLGVPPRDGLAKWQPLPKRYPTRAALLTKFEAWLDQNPTWWERQGDRRISELLTGKTKPIDGLRWLAWARISRAATVSRQKTADGNAQDFVSESEDFSVWLRLPATAAKRSEWKADFERLLELVCKP